MPLDINLFIIIIQKGVELMKHLYSKKISNVKMDVYTYCNCTACTGQCTSCIGVCSAGCSGVCMSTCSAGCRGECYGQNY